MKKYIIWIDSLISTFSIIEAGKDIEYNYQDKDATPIFKGIAKGDMILGYYSSPIEKVAVAFIVKQVKNNNTLILNKILETSNGSTIDDVAYLASLQEKGILEISDLDYAKWTRGWIEDVMVVEEADQEDIFSGFETWLKSDKNPDYTGVEKYNGYVEALEKLVKYMAENDLIEDANLNEKNPEKYTSILESYNQSVETQTYDRVNNHHKRGVAALKKYIKYIIFLVEPHATEFDYSVTKGNSNNKIFFGMPGCGKSYHIEYTLLGKDKYK